LNYHENVAFIIIHDDRLSKDLNSESESKIYDLGGFVGDVMITDRNDIEKIIKYLNSLMLIEDNLTEYVDVDLDEVGYFRITIFRDDYENDSRAYDSIEFETNYLSIIPSGNDRHATRYYIINSGYNNKTKSSNVHQFLLDLIK